MLGPPRFPAATRQPDSDQRGQTAHGGYRRRHGGYRRHPATRNIMQ
ncbi:MAG TPA: hypothetical protein VF838_03860 [Trebonia sp.]